MGVVVGVPFMSFLVDPSECNAKVYAGFYKSLIYAADVCVLYLIFQDLNV